MDTKRGWPGPLATARHALRAQGGRDALGDRSPWMHPPTLNPAGLHASRAQVLVNPRNLMSAIAIRPSAVAGRFYPGDPAPLKALVASCLRGAASQPAALAPKVLVVPHAGYVYSGPVAAQRLCAAGAAGASGSAASCCSGPSHRVAVRGLAAPTAEAFETPLGRGRGRPRPRWPASPICRRWWLSDAAHAQEHSLEVQLPFLQRVLRALHARAAGGRPRQRRRGGRGAGAAVGRRRDADRHQLRPVALPALCRRRARATARPCERILRLRHRPRRTTRPAARRR